MTTTNAEGLGKFIMAIEGFRHLDPEIPSQAILTFLHIAQADEPLCIRDIAERVGVSQASASRNVALLANFNRHGDEGHGLVVTIVDPTNRTRRLTALTPKGRKVAEWLRGLFDTE